jgi:hypothetical protein
MGGLGVKEKVSLILKRGFRKGFKQWNSNLNLNSSNQKKAPA